MSTRRERDAIRVARMADAAVSAAMWPVVAVVFAVDRRAPRVFGAVRGVLASLTGRCGL